VLRPRGAIRVRSSPGLGSPHWPRGRARGDGAPRQAQRLRPGPRLAGLRRASWTSAGARRLPSSREGRVRAPAPLCCCG